MHVAARTSIVAGIACAIVACSLTTDLGGLTGGSATPPAVDGAAVEGSSEAAAGDGSSGSSGSADGGRFCSTVPTTVTFCADFDDGLLPGPFRNVETANGGTVTLGNDARSAPNAVVFATPASASSPKAALQYVLAKNLTTVTVEFDVRVVSAGGSDFDLLVIEAGAPEVGFQLGEQGALTWDEDIVASTSIETPMANVALGVAWMHVRLNLVVDGAALNAELFLDGQSRATHTFEAKVFTNGDAPVLVLGDDSVQSAPLPWRVLVDNFTVDAH